VPGTNFQVVNSLKKGEEVYIYAVENNWAKIAISEQWVHTNHIAIKLSAPGL
jgi:uncharacterized protein YgiM (DUF1202 family)